MDVADLSQEDVTCDGEFEDTVKQLKLEIRRLKWQVINCYFYFLLLTETFCYILARRLKADERFRKFIQFFPLLYSPKATFVSVTVCF